VTEPPLVDSVLARLTAVAAWDGSRIRVAVATLVAVSARLPGWRTRLAEVARSLTDPECWSGPAARSAAAAVFELSEVAAAVDAAFTGSLTDFERLAGRAADAEELALRALRQQYEFGPGSALEAHQRLERAVGRLVPGMTAAAPDPAVAIAAEALEHAAAAAAAARAAGEPAARLGTVAAAPGATFGDLALAIAFQGPVAPPVVPRAAGPEEVAAWWGGLSAAAQLSALRSAPAVVGALDGVPSWARDRANRLLLRRTLRDPGSPPREALLARVVDRRIATEEAAGRQVQLQLLDLAGDRVVLALGDLDTADAVALLVPGVSNSPGDDLGALTRDAADVGDAARAAVPGLTVATAVWLGYRPPGTLPGIATRAAATRGGAALSAALGGLAAARAAGGNTQPRTTVLAHSYGTVVVDEAADVPGRLRADAVILLGSPGMEDDAGSLEAAEVYDAVGADDWIARLRYFGSATGDERYGSTGLPGDRSTGHSDYYDRGRPTLPAIGEVIAGVRVAG
jgi:hypothetical protein